MTSVALPCPPPSRVGGVFGALVDAILSPLRRLAMTPRQRRLNEVFGPIIIEIGAPILAAEDKADLVALLDEAAAMPQLLAFELLAMQELAVEIEAYLDEPEAFEEEGFVSLFGEGCRREAREMARLTEAHFDLLGKFDPARAAASLPDSVDVVRDLACPPEMARASMAGLRSEAAVLALMHALQADVAPWLRRCLAESAVDDRRRSLALLAAFVGDEAHLTLERVAVKPAPISRWLDEYRIARDALSVQVDAARAGHRRPFDVAGGDD